MVVGWIWDLAGEALGGDGVGKPSGDWERARRTWRVGVHAAGGRGSRLGVAAVLRGRAWWGRKGGGLVGVRLGDGKSGGGLVVRRSGKGRGVKIGGGDPACW